MGGRGRERRGGGLGVTRRLPGKLVETVKSSWILCQMRWRACLFHHDVKDSHEPSEVPDTEDMGRDASPCLFLCSFPCVFLLLCWSVPSCHVTCLCHDPLPFGCLWRLKKIHAICAHLS